MSDDKQEHLESYRSSNSVRDIARLGRAFDEYAARHLLSKTERLKLLELAINHRERSPEIKKRAITLLLIDEAQSLPQVVKATGYTAEEVISLTEDVAAHGFLAAVVDEEGGRNLSDEDKYLLAKKTYRHPPFHHRHDKPPAELGEKYDQITRQFEFSKAEKVFILEYALTSRNISNPVVALLLMDEGCGLKHVRHVCGESPKQIVKLAEEALEWGPKAAIHAGVYSEEHHKRWLQGMPEWAR